jgi:hypothetical protein
MKPSLNQLITRPYRTFEQACLDTGYIKLVDRSKPLVYMSTACSSPDLYKMWSTALARSKAGDDLLVKGDGWRFYKVPDK